MKVHYEPELAKRKPLAEIAEAATPALDRAIGPPASRLTAAWGFRADERGRPFITLTITDRSEHATAEFSPDELLQPDKARRGFRRLWGEVLEQTSNKYLKALEAVGAEDLE